MHARFILLALILALLGPLAPPLSAQERPPVLRFPAGCRPGVTCQIMKYVDVLPGPEMGDYACGNRLGGENDHSGTDIALTDPDRPETPVVVFAAARGVVVDARDGMADINVRDVAEKDRDSRKCGNRIGIRHKDSFLTTYCHLKMGSLKVRPGMTVEAGQAIAEIGLSGDTETPHLHFIIQHRDKILDPFRGETDAPACGATDRSLWEPDTLARLAYTPMLAFRLGFATENTPYEKARRIAYAPTPAIPPDAPEIFLWGEFLSVKTGDQVRFRILPPSGNALLDQRAEIKNDGSYWFGNAKLVRTQTPWPSGTYSGEITITRNTPQGPVQSQAFRKLRLP